MVRKQCTVYIPLREDKKFGDGDLHRADRWFAFKKGLTTKFGGFTMDPFAKDGEFTSDIESCKTLTLL